MIAHDICSGPLLKLESDGFPSFTKRSKVREKLSKAQGNSIDERKIASKANAWSLKF